MICRARATEDGFRRMALLRPEQPGRVLVIGLGKPGELDAERLRVAAARGERGAPLEAATIAWALPRRRRTAVARNPAAGLVEGTVLASTGSTASSRATPTIRRRPARAPGAGRRCRRGGTVDGAEAARVAAEAANRARELQGLPSNVVTPSYLADRAREIADAHESVTVEVLGRTEIEQRGMGGLPLATAASPPMPRCSISVRPSTSTVIDA